MNKQVKQSPIEQEAYDVILRQAVAVIEGPPYAERHVW